MESSDQTEQAPRQLAEDSASSSVPDNENSSTPEVKKQLSTAWLFDVDGVVTNPESKELDQPEIADFIVEKLQAGDPVALVTGRALPWVMKNVIPHITDRLGSNQAPLDNFYVSGEFGGAFTTWKDGVETHQVDPSIRVPEEIIRETKEAVEEFQDSHFFDAEKETMVSLEMQKGLTVKEFTPHQEKLAVKLRELIRKHNKNEQFEVHVDRIATNIRDRRANKSYAAEQVLEWIREKGGDLPSEFITFGDSTSDAEMSQQLQRMGIKTRLVFVGEREKLENERLEFPVEYTEERNDAGLVGYIRRLKKAS